MLYISSHLTALMLAIVPPISLGAVSIGFAPPHIVRTYCDLISGILRPVHKEAI